MARWLHERDVAAELASIRGPATFAWPQAAAPALALTPLTARAARLAGAAALALGLAEADPRLQPLTRLFSTRPSQNLTATIEPRRPAERTLCIVSHLDSSRSGLLFHPQLAPHLRALIAASTAAFLTRCVALVSGGRPRPLGMLGSAAAPVIVAGLALLAEREVRGEDVPGANDNASGVAVAATLSAQLVASPLESTRVVMLATGCEESGTVGMRSFLEATDTTGWIFLNLDGVGAPATLRYLPREGVGRIYDADARLAELCARLSERRPELGLRVAEDLVGLTYDATQVLARGGRAITLSAQDEVIPNYHTPGDTIDNLDADALRRAIETVDELAAAIDRGEAD